MWGAVDFDDGERTVVKDGKVGTDEIEFGEFLHGFFDKIHLLVSKLNLANDFDAAGFGLASAGLGGAENLAVQIENAHFFDDIDAVLDNVTVEIGAFWDVEMDIAATAGDALFDYHFAGDKCLFPGQPSFGHEFEAELIKLAPFVFDVEIFDGVNVIDGITIGIIMEKLGGDFLETAVGGGVFQIIERIAEVDLIKTREGSREVIVIIIDGVDIWLPERESEVGMGGE